MNSSSRIRQYFSNTIWMVGGRLTKAAVGFIIGVFVARYLGAERFGLLNYAIGVVSLFFAFGNMGMDGVLARELIAMPNKRSELLGSALALQAIGILTAFICVVVFLFSSGADEQTWILVLICAASFIFKTSVLFRNYYEALVKAKVVVVTELVQCCLSTCLRIYFIATRADLVWFAVSWLSEWAFTCIGLVFYFRIREKGLGVWQFKAHLVKEMFYKCVPFLISGMMIVVYQQVDKVMLKNLLGTQGSAEVGYYSAAARLVPLIILVPQMVSRALMPALVNAWGRDRDLYATRSQLFVDILTWAGIFLLVALVGMSAPIMGLYGDAYIKAIVMLRIMALKGLFVSMSVSSGQLILTEGLQKWVFIRNLTGCIVDIILNLLWIPKWGGVGAAWATVCAFSVSAFLVHAIIPEYRHIFMVQIKAFISGPFRLWGFMISQWTRRRQS